MQPRCSKPRTQTTARGSIGRRSDQSTSFSARLPRALFCGEFLPLGIRFDHVAALIGAAQQHPFGISVRIHAHRGKASQIGGVEAGRLVSVDLSGLPRS